MIERVIFGNRVRAVIRDWHRFWTRHPGPWYEHRFEAMSDEDRSHLLITLDRVRTDLSTIGAYFMEKPEGL